VTLVTLARAWLCLGLAAPAAAADAQALDLEGTWHVLLHYKDSASHSPEAERWDDRVWVIVREGDRLGWTEYPIVVFGSEDGRFGSVEGNPRSRLLRYWEPSPAQLQDLEAGPRVNSRGARTKRLRPDGDGWRSIGSADPGSASTITFTATWTIEDAGGLPVFRMEDVLGSALTEGLTGGTVYRTETVEEGGRVLRGHYDRDGTRIGTFRMLRTPPVRGLGTEEEQRERIRARQAERAREALGEVFSAPPEGPGESGSGPPPKEP
jgi:hypothetical protein